MCLPKPPKAPAIVVRDPVADEAKAQGEATIKANADLANRRRARNQSRVTTAGPQGSAPGPSILAQAQAGTATLGGQ